MRQLGNSILDGKFCLVYGHCQSGKTTAIRATAQWLASQSAQIEIPGFVRGIQVYVISFNAGIDTTSKREFWISLCNKLKTQDKKRFAFDEHNRVSSATF